MPSTRLIIAPGHCFSPSFFAQMMGDWVGGQSEYHFVPYADFQLLRLPKDRALSKMKQGLAFLSDILPTGYNVSGRKQAPKYQTQARPSDRICVAELCHSVHDPSGQFINRAAQPQA